MKNVSFSTLIAVSLSIILPLFFVISWHYQNNLYPVGDYADFLDTAQRMYLCLIEHGFLNFVKYALTSHLSTSVITVLIVPFFILSKGSILAAVSSLLVLMFTIYAIYLFLFVNIYFNRKKSILSSLFFLSIPWITMNFYVYSAEAFFYTFAMATIYHLIKSNYLKSLKHCFAASIYISLSVCTRPLLSTLFLSTFILIYLYYAFKDSNRICKSVLFLTPFVLWPGLVFLLQLYISKNYEAYFYLSLYSQVGVIAISIITLLALSDRFKLIKGLWALILIPLVSVSVWYLSDISSLIQWFKNGLILKAGDRVHMSAPQIVVDTIVTLGKIDFGIAFLLLLISLCLRKLTRTKLNAEVQRILVLLFSSSVISILVLSTTNANVTRYYLFYVLILFIFFLIASKGNKIIENIVVPICLVAGILYQGFYSYNTVFVRNTDYKVFGYFDYKTFRSISFTYYNQKPFRGEFPYFKLFNEFEKHVAKEKPIRMAIISLNGVDNTTTDFVYPSNLLTFSKENHYMWDFSHPLDLKNLSFSDFLKKEFDFLMLNIQGIENVASLVDWNVHEKARAWLIKRVQEFKLGPDKLTGLKLKLIFRINSYMNRPPGNIQIYKVLKEVY